ncbi:lytic transglycosylase domain-containing protein [Sagittula sp. SSi028]|uniref:lytic transglycosylase domain-containing protein n=1 Tax=Sagittula sp. SSi028 TaxID=3400636 RepID=UPI003AF67737
MFRWVLIVWVCLAAAPVRAEPGTLCSSGTHGQVQCIRPSHFVFDTCQALEYFARHNGLDPGFFTRLIWQESRFDPNALSHANAMGIAQFIASTARLRGLHDPYNPAEALEFSAEYLGEMSRKYGNVGLAAVGYNGGERRAEGLIAKTGGLARETVNYVRIITGLSAETWRDTPPEAHDFRLDGDVPFQQACHALARDRRLTAFPDPEPVLPDWGVQVAFGVTRDAALSKFRSATRACRTAIGGEDPFLVWEKSRASPRGGYYMARLGRSSRDAAWRLCSQLKRSGCVCAVYRTD